MTSADDDDDAKVDTEQVQNLITFNALVHTYWDDALCALRPISINTKKTSIEVAFHWLSAPGKITSTASDHIETMQDPLPHDINSFTESPGENICLIHGETRSIVRSGQIFTLRTDDPKSKPLQSMELLELQWILHRIAATRGAAEDDESEIDSDDDSVCVLSRSRAPVEVAPSFHRRIAIRTSRPSPSPATDSPQSKPPSMPTLSLAQTRNLRESRLPRAPTLSLSPVRMASENKPPRASQSMSPTRLRRGYLSDEDLDRSVE